MSNRPNFLFLFTDQQRFDTIHALGNDQIQTPNLDALAASSVVFDRCYTPAPVCVPARFSMLSGQYCAHTGCCNNNGTYQYEGEGFYDAFTKAGYDTCCVGKMHHAKDLYGPMGFAQRFTQEELSHPLDDYTRFVMESPYCNVFDYNGQRSELYYIPQISQLPAEYHPTQWVADRSLDFLLNQVSEDKPFFLMASFIHPHPPFAPPAPWNKLYRTVSTDPYIPEHPEEFTPFLSDRFTCEKIGISRQDLSLLRNYYHSCVSFVDYQVGRLVEALKQRRLYDNTVIVLSTDHGEMLGDFGTMGKRSMLDAASRIPLLLRVPGKPAQLRHDVCSLVDIAPTLLRCANIPSNDRFDGIDLFSEQRHDVVFSQYGTGKTGAYMVASNEDRLIYLPALDRYFYYNTIPEDTNKYDESSPRVKALQKLLLDYIASDCCDPNSAATADDVSGTNRFPYGPKRADHLMRQAEERARIPAGYTIDL